mgnify:CR=1 FL=1
MSKRTLGALCILCCATPLLAYVPAADSVYTTIAPARCKTIETHEEGASSVQKCAGVAGISPSTRNGTCSASASTKAAHRTGWRFGAGSFAKRA